MYSFIDTTETAGAMVLPAEAVSINGEYIENQIDGFRTLYTSGRESLEKDIESYDNTAVNGSLTKYTRFPARTITVGFQIVTDSPEEFRQAFNQLNAVLNVEDAEIIFADEDDKFFTGTPIMNAEVDPGLCSVTGEYEIYCADPFKYSVDVMNPQPIITEDADTGLYQTFVIDYDGTYPAKPVYTARFYNPDGETDEDNAESEQTNTVELLGDIGSCKYVAFMDSKNHVLQFGNPELEDESDVPDPLVLTNRQFKKSGSYDPETNGEEWVSPAVGTSTLSKYKQQGSAGTVAAIYGATQEIIEKDQTLLATTAGTGCKYKATVTKVNGRTSSKVKLNINVRISAISTTIAKGASLTVTVTYGDTIATKVLKSTSSTWKKKSSHSVSFSMTVSASSTKTELSGIKIKVSRSNNSKTSGSTGKLSSKSCQKIEIPYYTAVPVDQYYVHPKSYGAVVSGYYTGPTMTWTYPASGLPSTDDVKGAKAFDLTWGMKCCMGKTTNETMQMGAFECIVLTGDSMDANGNITNQRVLAGFRVAKANTSNYGDVRLYVNGKSKLHYDKDSKKVNLTYVKGIFGNENVFRSCSISKDATGKVTFKLGKLDGGKAISFVDSGIADARAYKVVFGFYRYSAKPAFDWNGINSVLFRKSYTENSALAEAPFSATQVLVADSSTYEVSLDDVSTPEVGALGNDWEQMQLEPGTNEITTAFSQRASASIQVIRHCRADEPFQGSAAYDIDDDGEIVDVSATDSDVVTYYIADDSSVDTQKLYSVASVEDGKVKVTTGQTFSEVTITEDNYGADPMSYLVVENPVPQFGISYREVYL